MGIAIPGKTVFLIDTAPRYLLKNYGRWFLWRPLSLVSSVLLLLGLIKSRVEYMVCNMSRTYMWKTMLYNILMVDMEEMAKVYNWRILKKISIGRPSHKLSDQVHPIDYLANLNANVMWSRFSDTHLLSHMPLVSALWITDVATGNDIPRTSDCQPPLHPRATVK